MKRRNGIKILLVLSVLAFALCATFVGSACKQPDPEPEVVLSLSKTQVEMVIGDTEELVATYENGGDAVVTYTSSNEDVATVDEEGVVTALSVGSATIQASYAGKTADCAVTVGLGEFIPVLNLTNVSTNQVTIFKKGQVDLSSTVSFNGKTYDDATVTYNLSDSTIATVVDGKLNPIKTGNVTVEVLASWRGVSHEAQASLKKIVAVEIIDNVEFALNDAEPADVKLYTIGSWGGETFQNTVTLNASALINGETYTPTISVISGDTLVSLDGNVLTAVGEGQAQIKFTCIDDEQKEHSFTINVEIERPVVEYSQTITNFSFMDDELDIEEIFGGSVTLTEAYQDGEALEISSGKVVGLKASNTEKTVTEITLYTADAGYLVNVEGYTKIINNEEDLKLFLSANSQYTANLTDNIWAGNGNEPSWAGAKTRKGYWFLNADLTIDGTQWSTMYNDRYFEEGVFDGNGHTINLTYGTGWSFGVFGCVHNAIIKDLQLNLTAVDGKINGNQNRACLLAKTVRDVFFFNVEVNVEVGGTTPSTPVDTLYLTTNYDGRLGMKDCVINIGAGILNANASVYGVAGNWTVHGTTYNTENCYVFTATSIADETVDTNLNYYYFATSKAAAEAGKDFSNFVNSGLWMVYNNNLIWKDDLTALTSVSLNDESLEEITVLVGETVTVKGKLIAENLTPALTVVSGEEFVSVTDNVVSTLGKGTATITVIFTIGEEVVEKTITVIVSEEAKVEEFKGGAIMLSDINDKAHLPNGLTPVKVTDENGVVYFENGAWDWTKIAASKTYEIVKKTLFAETETVTYIVEVEIYMGVIASEEDFKWFASTEDAYKNELRVNHTKYDGGSARYGYWIFAKDVTVNTNTWSKMYNNRYYDGVILDGNGYTLNINMDTGWSFGIFDKTYETLIKNLHFNITVTNAKLTANNNNKAIFADDMRNSALVDCLIDISAADTIATPVSELLFMTTYATNICLKNCVVNIGDGILAENAAIKQMAGNWVVHGTQIDTQNNYFFTSVSGVTANNCFVAKQVSEITSTNSWRYTFTEFLKSEWWTYNEQTQTLTWGLKVA